MDGKYIAFDRYDVDFCFRLIIFLNILVGKTDL